MKVGGRPGLGGGCFREGHGWSHSQVCVVSAGPGGLRPGGPWRPHLQSLPPCGPPLELPAPAECQDCCVNTSVLLTLEWHH